MKKLFTSLFILSVLVIGINQNSYASDVMCIAVYPCDAEGNLLEKYSDQTSPCFDYFLNQCLRTKIQNTMDLLKICEMQKSAVIQESEVINKTQKELRKAKHRIKKLRAKLRKL